MADYWPEFIMVALSHLLAVASPGPDLAVIIRQSLCKSRIISIWTSIGIGAGIMIHVGYSLLGLGLIISQSVLAFTIIKWIGAAYLLWIGWQCLRSKPAGELNEAKQNVQSASTKQSHWKAFQLGFLTNALNPKATLFFFALFSVIVSPDTPKFIQIMYGTWMVFATTAWFIAISLLLSRPQIKQFFKKSLHWVERVMGVVLVGLAARLFATSSQ